MIILIFSACFAAACILTESYRYVGKYYSTMQFAFGLSVVYTLLCRGYMLWSFKPWWVISEKVSLLIQSVVLLPFTTLLFLRYLPIHKWIRAVYFLLFLGLYVLMETFLNQLREIVYQHGWTFWWSVFLDVLIFAVIWIHAVNRKVAVPLSVCIIVFLMVWFRVPLAG